MVRVFLKGGVWKNSEDEILKAAIQKYGKQQWARVASLLNRKTAKQAKARWHEWLDPAIRKTEWSRPEEEQLVKLAQLFPAQWKTIAPMVGRTATQCQEQYESLLDQQATVGGEGGSAVAAAAAASAAATLRPGQIDAHPEGKPAKPDPVDMDEDELEMLQEARARLANTQGKKAKRKQRERLLIQAKRLADLQKRRELKQAGLLSTAARKRSSKRKNEIDFGVEIPFYKPAPAGFHDVSTEKARAEALRVSRVHQVDLQTVNESQYRTRDREAEQARKKEEGRLRMLQASNETYAASSQWAESVAENELPDSMARRGLLQLPAPTGTGNVPPSKPYTSLQAMGKGMAATQVLVSDETQRPLPTPMRGTPVSATPLHMSHQALMNQANQWRREEQGPTPLVMSHHDGDDDDDGIDNDDRKLPAVKSLPLRSDGTLNDDFSVGASTFATAATLSIRDLARSQRRAAKRARADLEAALQALPAPLFEYELAVPDDPSETKDDMDTETRVEDAADVQAAILEQQQMEADRLYRAQSSVIKRMDELPRPPTSSLKAFLNSVSEQTSVSGDPSILIASEILLLVQTDARTHPVVETSSTSGKGKKKKKKRNIQQMQNSMGPPESVLPLEVIAEDDIIAAKAMLQTEVEETLDERINVVLQEHTQLSTRDDARMFLMDEIIRVAREGAANMLYLPNRGWVESSSQQDQMDSLQYEFEVLQEAAASLKKKNDKIGAKLAVTTGGYSKRAETLVAEMVRQSYELETAAREEAVYSARHAEENRSGEARLDHWNKQIKALRRTEATLQQRYGALQVEQRRLRVAAAAEQKSQD